MASVSTKRTPLPPLDTDHRKLLNPHCPDDSPITDQEYASDDDQELPDDNVIGVSISNAQTYMKSPETPAVEKNRILAKDQSYFDRSLADNAIHESRAAQFSVPADTVTSTTAVPSPLPSPWRAHPAVQQRTSSIANAFNNARNASKRRSLSGSTMFDNLKKMLPDLSGMPTLVAQPNFSSNEEDVQAKQPQAADIASSSRPSGLSRNRSSQWREWKARDLESKPYYSYNDGVADRPLIEANTTTHRSTSPGEAHVQTSLPQDHTSISSKRHSDPEVTSPSGERSGLPALDGNIESLLTPRSPTSSLNRRNSESSLYLSRKLSGVSRYDDTSAFANVSEMANSRFKAITDSFQNSTLRFPKFPNVKTNFGKNASADDDTARNTLLNAHTSTHDTEAHYTNLHNIRKSRKLIEIETTRSRAHPVLSDVLDDLQGDLVVMGGYRGSILRDAKPPHRQLWAPVKVGLNLRRADLEVGLTREDEERATDKIIPGGILSHIGPIDICRRLLKHSRKCPQAKSGALRVHDWGYDWRLSPDLLAGRLIKYLESLPCNQSDVPPAQRGAWMIAHSLGGLITRYAVNIRPELFAGVLYAGTPMNCINILGPLRNGDDVLLSSKVLNAQVNFTIRTSYALLPEDGRCFIQKHSNVRYDVDFFDPQTWEDHHLSPCIKHAIEPVTTKQRDRSKSLVGIMAQSVTNLSRPSLFGNDSEAVRSESSSLKMSQSSSSRSGTGNSRVTAAAREAAQIGAAYADEMVNEPMAEASVEPTMSSLNSSHKTACTLDPTAAREYLARTLSEVLAFKRGLHHRPELQSTNKYPAHAIIFGKTLPTVYAVRVADLESIKYTDTYSDLAFAAGDGVVLASAAQLPEGYRLVKGGRIESDRGHVGLMGDLEGVGRALQALVEGRRRGVGMGCFGDS
jgi:hypothetical protein